MRITRWLVALATAYALGMGAVVAFATGAGAAHPNFQCIDAEPDEHYPTTNDDIIDYLTVSVGTNDAGHPPEQEGCVIEDEATAEGNVIDFEISGAGDPDDSDSPESPDFTCTVPANQNSCTIEPPRNESGTQVTRAWLDTDKDDGTVELDTEEGPNETEQPGAGEPDGTDAVIWYWTHGDTCEDLGSCPPPQCDDDQDNDSDGTTDYPDDSDCSSASDDTEADVSCCGDHRIGTTITISFNNRRSRFHGEVKSVRRRCQRGRLITLVKERKGTDVVVGRAESTWDGDWHIAESSAKGRFHAVVDRKQYTTHQGEFVACLRDRSPTIRVR